MKYYPNMKANTSATSANKREEFVRNARNETAKGDSTLAVPKIMT